MGPNFTPFTLIGSGPMKFVTWNLGFSERCSKLEILSSLQKSSGKRNDGFFTIIDYRYYRLGQTLNLATMSKQSIHFSEGDLY